MNNNYDDIINMKYQKSQKHPHIPISDRAAQFAPYAALTGYDDKVKETANSLQEQFFKDGSKKSSLEEFVD